MKDRPPRLLPSDRGSLGLAFKSASLSSLLTDLDLRYFSLISKSNGSDDGPIVSGVELFQEAETPTMF